MYGQSLVVAVTTAGDKAIAGPLVAAAVVLSTDTAEPRFSWSGPAGSRSFDLSRTDDVPPERRQQISTWLKQNALGVSLVTCTARQLSDDAPRAVKQAAIGRSVVRAVEHTRFRYPELQPGRAKILVGAATPVLRRYAGVTTQEIYRDRAERPWQVWAAYMLARAHRDMLMQYAAAEYPQYQFLVNFGYASTPHRDALEMYGPTRYHRMGMPLLRYLGDSRWA